MPLLRSIIRFKLAHDRFCEAHEIDIAGENWYRLQRCWDDMVRGRPWMERIAATKTFMRVLSWIS